jgi:hypothetical protein
MSKKLACFLLTASFLTAACGKEGPPSPPVPEIPSAVTDLVVSQRHDKLALRWSYPSLATSGKSLTHVEKIVVYRFDEEMSASLAESDLEVDETTAREIALFSQVATPTPIQVQKASIPVAEILGTDLPALARGASIVFENEAPLRTDSGLARRYTYAVVTEGRKQQSALSNLATIVPLNVAAKPTKFIARLSPEAIQLSWETPDTAVTGDDVPHIIGYRVYRSLGSSLGTAVNPSPVTGNTLEDQPPYGTYTYWVTALSATNPDIESAQSSPATVEFRDLLPPAVPTNLAVLLEDRSVSLIWDRVTDSDLAGYIVYRWSGSTRARLNERLLAEPGYRDEAPPIGIEHTYAVTSVDRSGNESESTKSEPVTINR